MQKKFFYRPTYPIFFRTVTGKTISFFRPYHSTLLSLKGQTLVCEGGGCGGGGG